AELRSERAGYETGEQRPRSHLPRRPRRGSGLAEHPQIVIRDPHGDLSAIVVGREERPPVDAVRDRPTGRIEVRFVRDRADASSRADSVGRERVLVVIMEQPYAVAVAVEAVIR